jgi:uncharacterized membrane protein
MRWIHILTMVIVLGGYIFLSWFWWPVVRRANMDIRLQIHLMAQTLRRFFTTVILALTVQLLTGGLYLLPPAYRAFGVGQELALASFHKFLIIKLIAVFIILLLVPMQLFGMAFRLTRMDAGILDVDVLNKCFHIWRKAANKTDIIFHAAPPAPMCRNVAVQCPL